MILPDFSTELAALSRGARRIAGVDEVGRGPLAGPVTAAAVVLDPGNIPEGLNDSKKLTARRREALAAWLARPVLPGAGHRRGGRPLRDHRCGLHPGQGGARPAYGGFGATTSRIRLGSQCGLCNPCAQTGTARFGRYPLS